MHSVSKLPRRLYSLNPLYWDLNESTCKWAVRYAERRGGTMPSMGHAGVLHYLKALDASRQKDGDKIVATMKKIPADDPLFGKGEIRVDGRKMHPMYLFEVKKPSESTGQWDLYKLVANSS